MQQINIGHFSAISVLITTLSLATWASDDKVTDYLISTSKTGESEIAKIRPQEPPPEPRTVQEQYLDQIDRIETEYGAYDEQLPQHLIGLGRSYQQEGNHDKAIEIFKRAIHINRINEGLYSLGQVPILEHLIESQVAMGDWEEANDRHTYLYWLNKRNYGEADPRMLPVINKLSSWHLNAYTLDADGALFYHLTNAHDLFSLAVDIIRRNYGANDLRMIKALQGLTVSSYYLATYQAETQDFSAASSSSSSTAQEKAKLDRYIVNSYNSGKNAISRMVNIYATNPESPPQAAHKAKVELGDWYLLFNKWHSALEMYKEAQKNLMASKNNKDEIERLFGQPVALPDLPMVEAAVLSDEQQQSYVLVQFDISPYGHARNINVVEAVPGDSVRNRTRVRKALKVAKFRPRFENGEPVITKGVTHRYLFAGE